MGSSWFSICRTTTNPCFSTTVKVQLPAARIRPQSCSRDEGNSSNTVDANLSVLRYRMEQVRMKEKSLDTCRYNLRSNGWNYRSPYDVVQKKNSMLLVVSIIQLASIVATSIGLVFLGGSIFIFLIALILHR